MGKKKKKEGAGDGKSAVEVAARFAFFNMECGKMCAGKGSKERVEKLFRGK